MKTLKNITLVAILAITVAACDKKNEGGGGGIINKDKGTYIGLLSVIQSNKDTFKLDNVPVTITKIAKDSANILMKGVKFAENMPITLDMTIPGVYLIDNELLGTFSLLGLDSIVPIAMGGAFPIYTITRLSGGNLVEGKLNLSMICGGYPLHFEGVKQ